MLPGNKFDCTDRRQGEERYPQEGAAGGDHLALPGVGNSVAVTNRAQGYLETSREKARMNESFRRRCRQPE